METFITSAKSQRWLVAMVVAVLGSIGVAAAIFGPRILALF